MKTVFLITQDAVFKFAQDNVKNIIHRNKSRYDLDEASKLLNQISDGNDQRIIIPEEPVYFDRIALDLIAAGHGSALCRSCNKWYAVNRLKPVKVGAGENPFDFIMEKKVTHNRLFRKQKPPEMYGGKAYSCDKDHILISVIIWKIF